MTIDEARTARLSEDPARRGKSMNWHVACDWCGLGVAEYTASEKFDDEFICRECRDFRNEHCSEEEIWREAAAQ